MTGAPIDNAITNTVLPGVSQGATVPDSIPLLADTPQLVMTPGVVKPNYLFADGDGVSGVIGNIYTGYGSGLGGTSIVVNNNDGDQFAGGASENGDFWRFSAVGNIGEKRSYIEAELMKLDSVTNAPVDGDIAVYDEDNDIWIPQKSEEPISGIIEVPQNKVYTIVRDGFAYDIEIVSTSENFESGSGTVTFPTGVIAAGTPITIELSALSSASFLNFQINYKRRLAP